MFDYKLALMTGADIPILNCGITVHQPTLFDIAFIGETDFIMGQQCLCINKNLLLEDEFNLEDTTNFQILMTIMSSTETKDKRESTLLTLQILFPNYKINLTPRSIIFIDQQGNFNAIDENNFDDFQQVLLDIFCFKSGPMDQYAFNPGDAKSREIAQKLMRGRQRVAAQQSPSGSNGSVYAKYISVLVIGAHIDINCATKLTLYQLFDLIERYSLYTNWDIDIRARLAGGKPDSRPDDWMKNIH